MEAPRIDASWYWPEGLRYVPDPGVDPPNCFSRILVENLPAVSTLLDLGCGSGVVGLYALLEKKAHFVTFADIVPHRLAVAAENLRRKGIAADRYALGQGGFADLDVAMVCAHDLIAFNPPQFPEWILTPEELASFAAPPEFKSFRGANPDGLALVRDFAHWFDALPAPKPSAIVNVSGFLGLTLIAAALPNSRIIARTRVPLRARFAQAARTLNRKDRRGRTLKRSWRGDWSEEILTIKFG
jgi:methylase of polypeptide subunit release factors